MHYYQFNIADYASHTAHLDPLEDLAYRRMLDWCYLHESPLPDDVEKIARLIRMQEHCKCIASALHEFFTLDADGWHNKRVDSEVGHYRELQNKRKGAANIRWAKNHAGYRPDASALQVKCKSNANHKPITNNHKPIEKKNIKKKSFEPPTLEQVIEAFSGNKTEAVKFHSFYESKGWMVGKTKMKSWTHAVAGWRARNENGERVNSWKSSRDRTEEAFDEAFGRRPNQALEGEFGEIVELEALEHGDSPNAERLGG